MLGDDAGGVHALTADERDKRERAAVALYSLEGRACAPITGLQQHALAGGRTLVLVATAARLYAFAGGPTLEALFSAYPESGGALPQEAFPEEAVSCRGDNRWQIGFPA